MDRMPEQYYEYHWTRPLQEVQCGPHGRHGLNPVCSSNTCLSGGASGPSVVARYGFHLLLTSVLDALIYGLCRCCNNAQDWLCDAVVDVRKPLFCAIGSIACSVELSLPCALADIASDRLYGPRLVDIAVYERLPALYASLYRAFSAHISVLYEFLDILSFWHAHMLCIVCEIHLAWISLLRKNQELQDRCLDMCRIAFYSYCSILSSRL